MIHIFGYGSLIATPNARPAIARGLQRGWFGRLDAPGRNPTYLGVQRSAAHTCNGVVLAVTDTEFDAIVEDELGYEPTVLDRDALTLLDGSAPPDDIRYFASRERLLPDPDFPISQGYVDVCIDACLQIGRSFAEEFIQSTSDWSAQWEFDRVEHPNAQAIDALLVAMPETREIYAKVRPA